MFVKPGDTVRFLAFFQSSSTGLGVTGLTVYAAVNRGTTNAVTLASNTAASVLDATNMPGWYYYDYTVPAGYYGVLTAYFTTADTSVSQRGAASLYISAQWVAVIDTINTLITSIDAGVTTLLTRIGAAISFVGGRVDANVGTMSSNALTAAALAADAVAEIADAVWDEAISGHLTTGTTGAKLNGASAAGDPLLNEVPGSYGAGTAGYKLGLLGTDGIVVPKPVRYDGELDLTWGESYSADLDNALDFSFPDLPTFPASGATYTLTITDAEGAATYITANGTRLTENTARFELLLGGMAAQRTTSLPKPQPRQTLQLPFRIEVRYPDGEGAGDEGVRVPIAYQGGICRVSV